MPEPALTRASGRDLRHDVGEPLLAICLYAQVLRQEAQIPAEMRDTMLEAIEGQAILLRHRLEEILGEDLSDTRC